jgi:hypothetical protein
MATLTAITYNSFEPIFEIEPRIEGTLGRARDQGSGRKPLRMHWGRETDLNGRSILQSHWVKDDEHTGTAFRPRSTEYGKK